MRERSAVSMVSYDDAIDNRLRRSRPRSTAYGNVRFKRTLNLTSVESKLFPSSQVSKRFDAHGEVARLVWSALVDDARDLVLVVQNGAAGHSL